MDAAWARKPSGERLIKWWNSSGRKDLRWDGRLGCDVFSVAGGIGPRASRCGEAQERPLGDEQIGQRAGEEEAAMSGAAWGASPAWPGVSTSATGQPRPRTAMLIFVLRPPRERSMA